MGMLQTGKPVRNRARPRTTAMSKQIQDAYIVAATRTPIGKVGRGYFKKPVPGRPAGRACAGRAGAGANLDPAAIEDAIIGCAFPKAEQGMNMARVAWCWPACRTRWAA